MVREVFLKLELSEIVVIMYGPIIMMKTNSPVHR